MVIDKGADANEPLHGRTPPQEDWLHIHCPRNWSALTWSMTSWSYWKITRSFMIQLRGPPPRVRDLGIWPRLVQRRRLQSMSQQLPCMLRIPWTHGSPSKVDNEIGMDAEWTVSAGCPRPAELLHQDCTDYFSKVHVRRSPNQISTSYVQLHGFTLDPTKQDRIHDFPKESPYSSF